VTVIGPDDVVLRTGPAANGGSCVARHDGRVVFVRYALPGELVRVRVTSERGAYWHAETIEVLEPSADRIAALCPIAGVDGAGCCDLAFAEPAAVREIKGQVVANQLARLGDYAWEGVAEPIGTGGAQGWRTRVRLDVGADGRAGFHRYHSDELVTDLRCGQLPSAMRAGIDGAQNGQQLFHVMAINRTDIGKPQFLEEGTADGHALEHFLRAACALLERFGQKGHHPFGRRFQFLKRRAGIYAAEIGGQGADRGCNRHLVVVQDNQQFAVLDACVIQRVKGHAGRQRAVSRILERIEERQSRGIRGGLVIDG
jgi:predicted RNA-binding protein with TRAM domain